MGTTSEEVEKHQRLWVSIGEFLKMLKTYEEAGGAPTDEQLTVLINLAKPIAMGLAKLPTWLLLKMGKKLASMSDERLEGFLEGISKQDWD